MAKMYMERPAPTARLHQLQLHGAASHQLMLLARRLLLLLLLLAAAICQHVTS